MHVIKNTTAVLVGTGLKVVNQKINILIFKTPVQYYTFLKGVKLNFIV